MEEEFQKQKEETVKQAARMEEINGALDTKLEEHNKAIHERLAQQDQQLSMMKNQISGNHEITMGAIANLIAKMDYFVGGGQKAKTRTLISPGGHGVHSVAPGSGAIVDCLQSKHSSDEFSMGLKVPGGQSPHLSPSRN